MAEMYTRIASRGSIPEIVLIGKANLMVIGYDDENDSLIQTLSAPFYSSDTKRLMRVSSNNDFLAAYSSTPANSPLVKFVNDYYNEVGGGAADAAYMYCYRYKTTDAGGNITANALPAGSNKEWRTEVGPVTAITEVAVWYDGSTRVVQNAAGYTLETDDGGNYTGKFTFGATFPRNASGVLEDVDETEGDYVEVIFSTGSLTTAMRYLKDTDVQFAALAYDHAFMTGSAANGGIYNGTSFLDDMKVLHTYCRQCTAVGMYRQAIISLPASKKPQDVTSNYGGGAGETFAQLRTNEFGSSENAIVASFIQDTDNGEPYHADFDGAAVMAGLIRKRAVRSNITGVQNSTAITPYINPSLMQAFKDARIATIVSISHLVNTTFLNYGYTLSTDSVRKWINFNRCEWQTKHMVQASLLQLLLEDPPPRYNMQGISRIKAKIRASMEIARMNGWHDGLISITIPIEEYLSIAPSQRNTTQQNIINAASATGIVDNIGIRFSWGGNVEGIFVTGFTEVLG